MTSKMRLISLSLLASACVIIIIGLFIESYSKIIIGIGIGVNIIAGIVMLINQYNKKTSDSTTNKIKEYQKDLKKFDSFSKEVLYYIKTIIEKFNNNDKLKEILNAVPIDEKGLAPIQDKANEPESPIYYSADKYFRVLEDIKNNFDINNIEVNKQDNQLNQEQIKDLILEIYVKLPYFCKLLDNVKEKAEQTIIDMIDKFSAVADANSEASIDANKNIEFLKNIYGGKNFDEVAKDSKDAYKKTKGIINSLISLNLGNRRKLDKIENWIKQIKEMLGNIQDIADQNKVIAINSSIEAARIGEAGQGFRVLVNEIQTLNQKTSTFTREINDIMASFEDFNEAFISDWDNETTEIVTHMESMMNQEEKIITKFIESFQLTIKSFKDLSESANEVDSNLSEILQSLQFEDITGQQIRHIKEFLDDILKKFNENKNSLKKNDIDINNIDEKLDVKVREELLKRVTVLDEKLILDGEI